MRSSESTKELIGALAQAQAEFSPLQKEAENPYYKSKYADLNAVVNSVQGPLGKHGLALTQHLESELQSYVDSDGTVRGERLVLCVVTRLEHSSGEFEESTLRLPLMDTKPQTLGSASTYARRYAMQSILRLAAEEDDGNASSLNENWDQEKRAKYVEQKKAELAAKPKPEPEDQPSTPAAKSTLKKQLQASIDEIAERTKMPEPAPSKPKQPPQDPGLISDPQRKMIWVIVQKRGMSDGELREAVGSLGYEDLMELPKSQVGVLLDVIDPDFKFHAAPRPQPARTQ